MMDPRWSARILLPTFIIQLVFSIIVTGLSVSLMNVSFAYDPVFGLFIAPLAAASATQLSTLVYLICYFTSSLHPLVVLTISIELMLLWLGTMVVTIVYFAAAQVEGWGGCQGVSSSSSRSSSVSDYSYDMDIMRGAEDGVCGRSTAIMVFVIVSWIGYVFLVTYAAIRRKRTKMPYVRKEEEEGLLNTGKGKGTAVVPRKNQPVILAAQVVRGQPVMPMAGGTAQQAPSAPVMAGAGGVAQWPPSVLATRGPGQGVGQQSEKVITERWG